MAKGTVQVAVPLAGGLDTKTDAKMVLPNKMLRMENHDFTKGRSVKWRAGYTAVAPRDVTGAAITDALGVAPLGDGFVLLSRTKAYMLDKGKSSWSSLGPYCPMTHEEREVAYSSAKQTNPDLDTANGVTAVAWEDSRGGIRCTVVDDSSGAAFVSEYSLVAANAVKPKVVAVGTNLLITWFDSANTAIKCRVVKTTDVSGTIGSADVTLTSDANATGQYDFCGGNGVAYLAFRQDAAVADRIRLFIVNSAGVVSYAVTIGAVVPDGVQPALAWNPNTNGVYVVFNDSAGVTSTVYWYDGANLTPLGSNTAWGGPVSPLGLALAPNALGGVSVWFQFTATGASNAQVAWVILNGALSGASAGDLIHAEIGSSGFFDGVNSYVVLRYNDSNLTNTENTFWVYRDDGVLVGRILPGEADGTTSWVPRVKSLGDKHQTALGYKRQVQVNLDKITGTFKQTPVFEHQGIQRCVFNPTAQPRVTSVDGVLYTSGGMQWAIDGAGAPVEAQMLMFPDQTAASMALVAGGSLTANSTYGYRVYFEWANAKGQRVRSLALSLSKATTASLTVRFTLQTFQHTRMHARSPVSIVIYRTEANQTTFYYRVTSSNPSAGGANGYVAALSGTAMTVTFDDTMADTTLVQQERDYVSEGETDHFAFDAPAVLSAVGNRVFCGGGGRWPDRPQFSLLRQDGRPVETNDTWVVTEFPEHGGKLTGFADVNGVPVVFKERALYWVRGTGPTNQRGAVSDYQAVGLSSDVGCTEPASLVQTPEGVFFKSAKGVYLLGKDGELQYVGAEVERYNSQVITGAAVVPDTNMVLFLTSSGYTLMYDYYYKEWGVYTNHEGLSCAVTNKDFAYLRTDGTLYIRDTTGTVFADNGIPFETYFRTAPLHLEDTVQGFEKLIGFQCVGQYLSPHITEVELFYNREPNPYQVIPFDPADYLDLTPWGEDVPWGDIDSVWGGPLDGSDYNFEAKPKRTKFSAISFGFRGRPGTPAGAGFEMAELLLDVKQRGGAARLATARKI